MKGAVLGPDGLGALKIGQSTTQAYATGDISKPIGPAACVVYARLAGSGSFVGTEDPTGLVVFGKHGIAAIYAYGTMATPQGIRLGSTAAEVRRAYPNGVLNTDTDRMNVAANAAGTTEYRIVVQNDKVVELAIQARPNGCYE